MAPEVKTAKNSKLPKNCSEPVGKGGWPPISIWIKFSKEYHKYWNDISTNSKQNALQHLHERYPTTQFSDMWIMKRIVDTMRRRRSHIR
jgi:hypothetical protein